MTLSNSDLEKCFLSLKEDFQNFKLEQQVINDGQHQIINNLLKKMETLSKNNGTKKVNKVSDVNFFSIYR